jgi:hypothetical protein
MVLVSKPSEDPAGQHLSVKSNDVFLDALLVSAQLVLAGAKRLEKALERVRFQEGL